jgi:hypothetical protein
VKEGKTVFRPFALPAPFTSLKDVFCLTETRVVDAYGKISWQGRSIDVPKEVPPKATVELHIVPDAEGPELRLWYRNAVIAVIRIHKS